jgi:hypothetical protein
MILERNYSEQSARRIVQSERSGNYKMDTLAETLDVKLRQWKPETAAEVRE